MISLINGKFTTTQVLFDNGGKRYTYKTDIPLEVGDQVVVEVRHELKIVRVVHVDETPRLDANAPWEYRWIVSKVDYEGYQKLLKLVAIGGGPQPMTVVKGTK